MVLFKCKMCGGALEINNNETVVTCEYCGTQQTLPKLDDDKRANMYDRANHFRRNNEFDKAMGIYEQILNEDNTDAEAYWSLILCHYGIEYVEDPSSHKRIPTVNRAQFTSIFDDDNYKSALKYADSHQHEVYESEAHAINEIQKGILAISQKEEPFDVFICYKESDSEGKRTPDSVLAQELYFELKQEGFKVFFSRITLEDKLGSAYEPYIFAALNSAKVMVVLGTRPEYFNAVWVKNEWSRYLALIKQGEKKMLIPAYKDMDPYDLPEEFSHLQAQDMSKLGFMQDLIRGIKKIAKAEEPKPATVVKETVVVGEGATNIAPLLKRVFMFLEDGDWASADEYCERVLDAEPECADAYLGKLMVKLKVKQREGLKNCPLPFDGNNEYHKVIRFADAKLKDELGGYIEHIKTRNENARKEEIYVRTRKGMASAESESGFNKAAQSFESISGYKDSSELAKECREKAKECYEKAETARKDGILEEGKSKMFGAANFRYEEAIKLFETIPGWRDADECIEVCRQTIKESNERAAALRIEREHKEFLAWKKAEKKRKQKKIIKLVLFLFFAAVIGAIVYYYSNYIGKYDRAVSLMESGEYTEAISLFRSMGGYMDSAEKIDECYKAKYSEGITFGVFEQDNNAANGNEDIEWIVLDVKDGKALLISKYGLAAEAYDTGFGNVTWETSSIRKWLNGSFLTSSFSFTEKNKIAIVTVPADPNPAFETDPGNDTQDKIFLLSIAEANAYFDSESDRQCKATDYAVTSGVYEEPINSNCWWWLRTPGNDGPTAALVRDDGAIEEIGYSVGDPTNAVRPALWIDLSTID